MAKIEREFPWCSLICVTLTVLCHYLVLKGNLQTSQAFAEVSDSTLGWSKVGLGIARAFREELNKEMEVVSESLTEGLADIAQVQDVLDMIISKVGNETEEVAETEALLLQTSSSQPVRKAPDVKTFADLDVNIEGAEGHLDHGIMVAINRTNAAIKGAFATLKETVIPKGVEFAKSELKDTIMKKITESVDKLVDSLNEKLDEFFAKIRPALEQVADWLQKFADKVLQALEGFSGTLDNVQNIFDQVMSQLSPGQVEGVLEKMVHDTFTLFDVSDTGSITVQDLLDIREIYSLDPLQGNVPAELVEKYDADGSGDLDEAEFTLATSDPDIPGILSVVLRVYARRLAEVAGVVGEAEMRGELSEAVVKYFQLVCSKNKTKLSWVSDMLSNGTLPVEFTADVMGQLALAVDDVDVLTNADVGFEVIQEMMMLHPEGAMAAFDRLTNATFWAEEGFDPLDFAVVIARVSNWITQVELTQTQRDTSLAQTEEEMIQLALNQLIADMPALAHEKAKSNLAEHHTKRRKDILRRRKALFASKSSRFILHHMSGSMAASDPPLVAASPAEKAINSGQPAKPETLEFVKWLSWNASDTAEVYQQQCFDDSSKSSSTLDSFSQQIEGMVKKITGFLEMMKEYAKPDALQAKVTEMTVDVKGDLLRLVENLVDQAIEVLEGTVVPLVEDTIDKVENKVLETVEAVETQAVKVVELDIAGTLNPENPALQKVAAVKEKVEEVIASAEAAVSTGSAQAIIATLTEAIQDLLRVTDATEALPDAVRDALGITDVTKVITNAIKTAIEQASQLGIPIGALPMGALPLGALQQKAVKGKQAVFQDTRTAGHSKLHFSSAEMAKIEADAVLGAGLSGGFEQLILLLQSLNNMLPQAAIILKEARITVDAAAQQMDSVFNVLGEKSPPMFLDIAAIWKMVWILYFFFFAPLTLLLLVYAFWASGYFGGPEKVEEEDLPESPSFCDRLRACYQCCCTCCVSYHDTALCFWSCIILMQVVALLIFVLCITLCIVGGVQSFMVSGCAQVYMLNDPQVCHQTLLMFKEFMKSFHLADPLESLDNACANNDLLTCRDISAKMKIAVLLTSVFSFLAALMSFEMILEASVLHERARWRRLLSSVEEEVKK